jgi:hypothetical protein
MGSVTRFKAARQRIGQRDLVASVAGNGVNISLYRDPQSGRYRVLAYCAPFGSGLPDGKTTWSVECHTRETAAATGVSWARRLGMLRYEALTRAAGRERPRAPARSR